tara:strand:- start:291 stop:527 length:237 start_codon:yes stop_codon:yes gene_type:complete
MRIYRVAYSIEEEDEGYEFFSSRAAAHQDVRDYLKDAVIDAGGFIWSKMADIEELDVELTEKGVLEVLNRYASHPKGG